MASSSETDRFTSFDAYFRRWSFIGAGSPLVDTGGIGVSDADIQVLHELFPMPPDRRAFPALSRWWQTVNRLASRHRPHVPSLSTARNDKKPTAAAAASGGRKQTSMKRHPTSKRDIPGEKVTVTVAAAAAAVRTTPKGQLKDFRVPMADAYEPKVVETSWDAWWEAQGLYAPSHHHHPGGGAVGDENKKETAAYDPGNTFVMILPPPNVTGSLHIGHALTVAIEDTLCRWHRMCGKNVLWVPGTDHAGIATQVVVEKKLERESKKTRHDLGRAEFLKQVWKWKDENGSHICNQLRRLGASVDWSRERFTMDETSNAAVTESFVRLHRDGLIYRANRLVNWSCTLRTAISSVEVYQKEIKTPTLIKVPGYDDAVEFGVLHSFSYKFADGTGEIVVATTRMETMLGDVAVAVHPDDSRHNSFIGKALIHPFVPERKLLVIADTMVDPAVGTGAVKITPAHDHDDFQCAQRHSLECINIFTDAGEVNEHCGGARFAGQPRFVARASVIAELKRLGQFKGTRTNEMSLAMCSRSHDIIEPMLRPQWWVNCKDMAARAVHEVKERRLEILPRTHERMWFQWLDNCHDWCISRQLWWGHRIPAWFVTIDGVARGADHSSEWWVVARNVEQATVIAHEKWGRTYPTASIHLAQDEDVLDTWYSSALSPMSTMGWPNEATAFYPGTVLETGHDILFFWVARMVMMGVQLTGKLPFTKVYLHPMVRDKLGRKMSKSKGNVVDPIDVMEGIELPALLEKLRHGNLDGGEVVRASSQHTVDFPQGIPECGADALRLGLLASMSSHTTRDINLDVLRVVAYRKFCNKLWNATKFALTQFDRRFVPPGSIPELDACVSKPARFADRWILSRLARTVAAANDGFAAYEFAAVVTRVHDFWLDELCGRYLELTKRVLYDDDDDGDRDTQKKRDERASVCAVLFTCLDWGCCIP